MKLFLKIDFLSRQISILGNESSKNLQNIIGAFLSSICILLLFAASSFFVINFFTNSKPYVSMSTSYNDNFTIVDFQKVPFMMRLSDEYSNPNANSSRLYRGRLLWANTYIKDDKIIQNYTFYETVPCDINKHFDIEHREFLKENIKDINSYQCADIPNNTQLNLTALYGGSKLYTYSFYVLFQCNTTDESKNCYSQSEIDKLFQNYYYDVVMLDYYITHENKPYSKSLYTNRGKVNNKSRKSIRNKIKTIKYETDIGLVFENIEKAQFHQVIEYQIESIYDLPDGQLKGIEKGNIGFFNNYIFNHNYIEKYSKSYMKAQDLLAVIGGILKMLISISQILIYVIGQKTSMISLINSIFYIEDYKEKIKKGKQLSNNIDKDSLVNIVKNNYMEEGKKIKEQKEIKIEREHNDFKKRTMMTLVLPFYDRFFYCSNFSKESKVYKKIIEEFNYRLNIRSIILNSIKFDGFLRSYLSKDESLLFDYLYDKRKFINYDFNSLNNVIKKESIERSEYESKLMEKIMILNK